MQEFHPHSRQPKIDVGIYAGGKIIKKVKSQMFRFRFFIHLARYLNSDARCMVAMVSEMVALATLPSELLLDQ